MRILLILWATPLAIFWAWYGLSAYDLNLGTHILSRNTHDLVFLIYGRTLGMAPSEVPGAIAGACALDTALVMALLSWRWRNSWLPQARAFATASAASMRRRFQTADFPRF